MSENNQVNQILEGISGNRDFFRLDTWNHGKCHHWLHQMSKQEMQAAYDNPTGFADGWGWTMSDFPSCLEKYKQHGGTFEAFYTAILASRVKHWLYWWANFTHSYLEQYATLVSLLNFRHCESKCKTCSLLCKAKPQNNVDAIYNRNFYSGFGNFPEETTYFNSEVDSAAEYVEHYFETMNAYFEALTSAGVDMNTVDFQEIYTGKKLKVKKQKQPKPAKKPEATVAVKPFVDFKNGAFEIKFSDAATHVTNHVDSLQHCLDSLKFDRYIWAQRDVRFTKAAFEALKNPLSSSTLNQSNQA